MLTTGNGTGLGGQRFIKSFILSNPNFAPTLGDGLQLVYGEGQSLERATARNPDGTLQWSIFALTQGSGAPMPDPIHSDVWDFSWDPSGYQAWLGCDGGVWSITPFAEFPVWYSHNENLATHHIHTLTVLPQNQVRGSRLVRPPGLQVFSLTFSNERSAGCKK